MGTFADSLFNVLMSWVRALVSAFWALFSSENTTALEFLGKNWLMIALVIVAAGLAIDWLVWLIRWQPYHLWARRMRRWLHIEELVEDEDELPMAGDGPDEAYDQSFDEDDDDMRVYRPAKKPARAAEAEYAAEEEDERELWLPQPYETLDEEDEQAALQAAEEVPDEELRAYPGMRYGAKAQTTDVQEEMGGTQRYAAVHSEGPGAAEVKSRRAEIDAWQLQMQEEARQKAQAERARLEAERLAQEEYEAEQARLAQEECEAEQARLAQEEYERQLAEYERQKAQYERDLAEYERQKAIYDAQMAAQAAQQDMEAAAELADGGMTAEAQQEAPAAQPRRRRNRQAAPSASSYSDMVEGEQVDDLPPPPSWPRMERTQPAPEQKPQKENALLSRMARMIEPEEEDLASLHALPPRVDMKAAYKPARKPENTGKRES
ncbi:MAG: hypothetical protein J6M47_07605 [Clostridia bacterium]|nr:hypothetical protein [Clostridia bacterium]